MKIAYVCADQGISLLGNKGASVHMRSLATALARRNNDLVIACRKLGEGNPAPDGLRVEVMPPDERDHVLWLADLLRAAGTEVVLERYSLSSGPAAQAARGLGLPLVLEVNAPLVEEASKYRGLLDVGRWQTWEAECFWSANRVVAVSTAIRNHVLRTGVDADQLVVIPNGVDVATFSGADGREVRQAHGLGDAIVVGFTGSLKPWHGVDILIEAFAGLGRELRLLLVGDGPERARLGELAESLGIDERVIFSGAVPHAQVPSCLAAMDIGAAPYAAQDDFYFSPLKVAEYLAAGLPVVVSNQGDISDLVGGAGLLVPPDDTAALEEALRRLCEERELRARLAAAARTRALDLDWQRVAARVEEVLHFQEVTP